MGIALWAAAAPIAIVTMLAALGCNARERGQAPSPAPSASASVPSASATVPTATGNDDAGTGDADARTGLRWRMELTPTELRMADRKEWTLAIGVSNAGTEAVDTRRDELRLLVNGKASTNFRLNWGNGHRDRRWALLPAGESVEERRHLGESLFREPGDYEVVLQLGDRQVARGQVRVAR
ncbi:MAG: hypothetical protein HY898_15550 [Deltaproteobacteria bacterium]|nr:hypothetical protein [Deltaproteobacteria bacterium]